MSDADLLDEAPGRAKPIPRESWRQEKAVVWVRNAVTEDHLFLAYDRAAARNDKSHLFQWKRGQKASTLDTELIVSWKSLRFEFKSESGAVKDGDGQSQMIAKLRSLNIEAGWGRTIMDLFRFYRDAGVKLAANAEYQAMHYDGMVDSRIAKEEAKRAGALPRTAKKSSPRKAPPRYTAGKRMVKRAAKRGIFV